MARLFTSFLAAYSVHLKIKSLYKFNLKKFENFLSYQILIKVLPFKVNRILCLYLNDNHNKFLMFIFTIVLIVKTSFLLNYVYQIFFLILFALKKY